KLTGNPIRVERLGRLQLWLNGGDIEDLRKHAAAQQEAGIRAEVLDPAAVKALEPKLVGEVIGAVLFPDHGRLDAAAVTASAADAARKRGASIREGEEVMTLLVEGDRVCGVRL